MPNVLSDGTYILKLLADRNGKANPKLWKLKVAPDSQITEDMLVMLEDLTTVYNIKALVYDAEHYNEYKRLLYSFTDAGQIAMYTIKDSESVGEPIVTMSVVMWNKFISVYDNKNADLLTLVVASRSEPVLNNSITQLTKNTIVFSNDE